MKLKEEMINEYMEMMRNIKSVKYFNCFKIEANDYYWLVIHNENRSFLPDFKHGCSSNLLIEIFLNDNIGAFQKEIRDELYNYLDKSLLKNKLEIKLVEKGNKEKVRKI